MHPNPRKIAPVIVFVILALLAWWYFDNQEVAAGSEQLSASGTIEATQVIVSAELGGRVAAVLAQEGDEVNSGQVLVRFEDSLLGAQFGQAQAALALAQANYDLVVAGQASEQRQAAIATAELELISAQQALQELHDNADLTTAQALQAIAAADKALDRSKQRVDNLHSAARPADIDAAQAAVVMAKDRLERAQKDFAPYEKKQEDNVVRAMLLSKTAEAQKQYDAVVTRLNNLLGEVNNLDLAIAEADETMARAQLADAQRRYEELEDGPDLDALALARARLEAAETRLAAARATASTEQVAVALAQVEHARAASGVIQAQMEKLTLNAPIDGIVLSRSIQPGEASLPGAPLLVLARLDELTITLFLPEDRYGELSLGQTARVSVDSFPGETFTASVAHIADQAEFTPRNVQTAEGRRTTVFAVKLKIDDAGGKLKPGMPADVDF